MKTDVWMNRFCWGGSGRWLSLAALLLMALSGCGGGDQAAPKVMGEMTPDQQQIASMVDGVSDMAGELTRLRESFTKDNAPTETERKKYSDHMFSIGGDINVSGDTASFPVSITKYGTENSIEKQWKAVKENGTWKLSDTPLP